MSSTMITNTITGEKIVKPITTGKEIIFDGGVMITETDTAGIITYANSKFRRMTGYSKEQLIGSPHSINRHPDMPKAAFKAMWDTIKEGNYWNGYVKNMAANGSFYLVLVWIKPKFDNNGNIVGYIAGRKIPEKEPMEQALIEYKTLREAE